MGEVDEWKPLPNFLHDVAGHAFRMEVDGRNESVAV